MVLSGQFKVHCTARGLRMDSHSKKFVRRASAGPKAAYLQLIKPCVGVRPAAFSAQWADCTLCRVCIAIVLQYVRTPIIISLRSQALLLLIGVREPPTKKSTAWAAGQIFEDSPSSLKLRYLRLPFVRECEILLIPAKLEKLNSMNYFTF